MGRHGGIGCPHAGEDLGGGVLLAHQRAGHHAPEADAPVAEILAQPARLLAAHVRTGSHSWRPRTRLVRDGPGIALPWEGGVSRRKIIVRRILEACPPPAKQAAPEFIPAIAALHCPARGGRPGGGGPGQSSVTPVSAASFRATGR